MTADDSRLPTGLDRELARVEIVHDCPDDYPEQHMVNVAVEDLHAGHRFVARGRVYDVTDAPGVYVHLDEVVVPVTRKSHPLAAATFTRGRQVIAWTPAS